MNTRLIRKANEKLENESKGEALYEILSVLAVHQFLVCGTEGIKERNVAL